MSLFRHLARVRAAETRVALASESLAGSAGVLLQRGQRHPLSTLAVAAGAGFVLGQLGVGVGRVPGVVSFLAGGLSQLLARGMQLIAAFGTDGLGELFANGASPQDDSAS